MNLWQTLFVFFAVGLVVGGQINHAIYRFSFRQRAIGPWMAPAPDAPPRRWLDYVPLLGWISLSRESSIHGANYWLRPLLIELCLGFGFAGLWAWEIHNRGLMPLVVGVPPLPVSQLYLILVPHLVLVSLLAAATFIDLDEQMIPDQITVPETLFALSWFAAFPSATLPVLGFANNMPIAVPMRLSSPLLWPTWLDGRSGLLVGIGIFAGWCWALAPSTWTGRHGWGKGLKYLVASWIQPRRKAHPGRPRSGYRYRPNRIAWLMAIAGSIGVFLVWSQLHGQHWRALLSALVGLGFAGGVIWAIRIIARWTLHQEAMGFGDVTLLAMIGAFMGWQSGLPVMFLAPFAGLLIGLVQWLVIREKRLAFGPYLCLAAVLLLLRWPQFWLRARNVYSMGLLVPKMVGAFLVMLLAALFFWQLLKTRVLGIVVEER